jgi:Mrp family chromosome partitioning ATPase
MFFNRLKHKSNPDSLPLINAESSKTRYAESFRTLRTNIHFALVDEGFKSLLVTSAGAGEGKTNTAANLAFTIAQAGKSVLMVDCDLRLPTLTKISGDRTSAGITGLLVDVFSSPLDELTAGNHTLFDILRLIGLQHKTCRLLAQDGKEEVELYFIKGSLKDLNWITRPAAKKLASVLVKNGHLTREQAKLALTRQKDTGNRLGYIIAKMNFVAEAELKAMLHIHVMETLHKLLEMQNGDFIFSDCPASEINTSTSELLDLEELLYQAASGYEKLPLLDSYISEAVLEVDENLFLLPTGIIPPNPTELLVSNRLQFLFERLQSMFDVLVIDSPPILPASDALILAPNTDGVLLVIKAGELNRDMVGRAIEQLRNTKANLLGVVLNQVDTKREGYYKYYHKYYSEYYGLQK